jgi:hypothetical protein
LTVERAFSPASSATSIAGAAGRPPATDAADAAAGADTAALAAGASATQPKKAKANRLCEDDGRIARMGTQAESAAQNASAGTPRRG